MKLKLRLSGRGGQGIKFVGSMLVQVAMVADYYATLSVDYTPSVRGGPIFCGWKRRRAWSQSPARRHIQPAST